MGELFGIGGFGEGGYGTGGSLVFDETVEYYINLLIIQYYEKARARLTVGSIVQQAVADDIVTQVKDGFDLETAVGAQLDILAAYRGAQRVVYGLDLTREYFSTPYYDDDPSSYAGFAYYDDAVVSWYFLLYVSGSLPLYAMTDDELRRLTKFLAKTQSRLLSVKEIDDVLWEFFGNEVALTDNLDMTITYTHDVGDPDTLFGIVQGTNSLPTPAGVEVIVV